MICSAKNDSNITEIFTRLVDLCEASKSIQSTIIEKKKTNPVKIIESSRREKKLSRLYTTNCCSYDRSENS